MRAQSRAHADWPTAVPDELGQVALLADRPLFPRLLVATLAVALVVTLAAAVLLAAGVHPAALFHHLAHGL